MGAWLIVKFLIAFIGRAHRTIRDDRVGGVVSIHFYAVGVIFVFHFVELHSQLGASVGRIKHRRVLFSRHDAPRATSQHVPYDGVLHHALVGPLHDLLSYGLTLLVVRSEEHTS